MFSKSIRYFDVVSIALVLLATLLPVTEALAGLQLGVAPVRVEFDDRTRSAQVTLVNAGDTTGTLRLSLINQRMTESGELQQVDQARPGELFADKLIRFSPRQVTLAPGQSQVVRLAVRKPAELAPGEYRSHLLFAEEPQTGTLGDKDKPADNGLRIQVKALLGISIPVIIRHKTTPPKVSINSARLIKPSARESVPRLDLLLLRTGNASAYGELRAEYVPEKGERKLIGQINGLAIYTPGTRRSARMPLELLGNTRLSGGFIELSYREPAERGGRIMARARIPVP